MLTRQYFFQTNSWINFDEKSKITNLNCLKAFLRRNQINQLTTYKKANLI